MHDEWIYEDENVRRADELAAEAWEAERATKPIPMFCPECIYEPLRVESFSPSQTDSHGRYLDAVLSCPKHGRFTLVLEKADGTRPWTPMLERMS